MKEGMKRTDYTYLLVLKKFYYAYAIGNAKILTSASSVRIMKLSKKDSLTVWDTLYVTEKRIY